MPTKHPISPPAAYVAPVAIGFADSAGDLALVTQALPLPVSGTREAAPAALQGEASQSLVAGPFAPLADAPIHLKLAGQWSGRVALQRSTDGGTTRYDLTAGGMPWAQFSANANEVVWQEGERGATFYLDIQLTSGALTYRLSQ